MKKKKLTSLIVLVFVLLCNCDYFKSLCEPENDPKKQPTTLQNIVNNATDGEIINLEEWENVTDYTATIDKKLTIKSGNLNGASLTVKAENVKLEKMQNLSVETSSRLTIKDSKLNNLLLGGNAQSRSNTTAEINVILENCEIAEKIKINSKAKLNIAGEKTKIAKIVVAVAAEVCKILCTTEVDTKKIENVITDENGEKPEEIKITQAYKIIYHSNCDELEDIEDFFSPDDETISLPTDIFKRNEYIFAGWYYDNNQAVEDSINVSDKTADIHVYAKWEPESEEKIAGEYKLLNESAIIKIENDGKFVVTVTISSPADGYMNGNWKKANEENYEFIFDDGTTGTATSIEEDVIKMVYLNEAKEMNINSYAVKTSDEDVDLSETWTDGSSKIIISGSTFTAIMEDGSVIKNGNVEKTGNFFKLQELAFGAISASKQALYIDPYGKEITPSVYTKSTTNEESFEDLGGTGVYSYTLNLNDISNAWNGSPNNPNFSIVLLTDAQVKASVNKFNFSSYAYQFYSYGDMGVGNPIMPGNYAVYGKNCYENSEYKYYSGVAATVTDTTLEVFVDMSQIMKAELKFFNSDTESEANLVTENMPVDLTDYKPYVFALIDGEKDPDNYVMTNETWNADLMAMTAGATFPTNLQQSPPTTGNENSVTVTNISVNSTNHKTSYYIGEELDLTGLPIIEVKRSNGTTETLQPTSEMITGFDSSTAGTKTLTITYGGCTTTFNIEVKELTATADDVGTVIAGLSAGTYTLKVTGEITSTTITEIANAIRNLSSETYINLDLSGTTGLTEIPENAFYIDNTLNYNLISIIIPDSVISIGDYAFCDCFSLTRITIPNSVTSIGSSAFAYCLSLTSVTIPNNVTTIDVSAFYYCENLTSITIPDSVTSIADDAFRYCSNLTNVTIPDSVTTIGNYAFSDCSSLTSVTFNNTSGWYYTNNSDFTGGEEIVVTDPAQNAENLKDTYSGYYWYRPTELTATADNVESTITGLSAGTYMLKVSGEITSTTITTIVTAMNNNTKAKINLDLSGTTGLTEIANNAFLGCSSTSIIIPNSVKSIGENAFFCSDIKSITIPNNVVTINAYAFQSCSNLTNITIGNGVQSIGNSAFSRCSNLTKFEVDTDNQYYSSSDDGTILFNGDKTKLIAYPSATGDITVPDGVTSIDIYAFHHCSDLTNITIPDSVTSIGYAAFSGCSNLTNFEVDTGNTNYSTSEDGTILFNGDKTKLIVYPSATGDITIPNGVTSIDSYAFYRCSGLTSIEIPNSVTTIGSNAFYYCEKLTSVTFKDTTSTWYYTDSENYTGGQTISVTNATENATYLKETYYDKYWYKESSVAGTTE